MFSQLSYACRLDHNWVGSDFPALVQTVQDIKLQSSSVSSSLIGYQVPAIVQFQIQLLHRVNLEAVLLLL